ncbi:MAG: hypothetical protein NVV74_08795 [Magnetospirillum sp.]|nr:hypothetical protein [Magnetospirillum sp.]
MIPAQNRPLLVFDAPFERLQDLVEAMRDANIVPRRIPADGSFAEHRQPIERFDLEIRIRYRVEIDPARIDGSRDGQNGAQQIRAGAGIKIAEFELALHEISTGILLDSIHFALSGRIGISGSLRVDHAEQGVFFVYRQFLVSLDDASLGLPPPFPTLDLERLLERVADRGLRAKLNTPSGLPESRLPIAPRIENLGVSGGVYGLDVVLRDPRPEPDWLSCKICLPPGMGDPRCIPGTPPVKDFFSHFDIFMGRTPLPVPAAINRLGRHFQVDIGMDLLREQIATLNANPDWRGDNRHLWLFRVTHNFWIDIEPFDDSGQYSFSLNFSGDQYILYPQVKMCEERIGTPWGDIVIDVPCGVEEGWMRARYVRAKIKLCPSASETSVCFDRSDLNVEQGLDWGFLLELLYAALASAGLGAVSSLIQIIFNSAVVLTEFLIILIALFAKLLVWLFNQIAPNQICLSLQDKITRIPLVDDKIEVSLDDLAIDFTQNGMSLAFNGDFERRTGFPVGRGALS